jgi:hypothetical protein
MGAGSKFSNPSSPAVVVKVGASGSRGVLEITDMIFKTRGPGADYCCCVFLTIMTFLRSRWCHSCGMEHARSSGSSGGRGNVG